MGRREQLHETTDVRVVVAEAAPPADGQDSLRSILESEGFQILGEASDPGQLSSLLAETDPQVIVFDAGTTAVTILAVRDWAPQAGIVVVWPPDVAAAGADQQVEPAKAASDLGDAVRRARRSHGVSEEPIVVPEAPSGRTPGKSSPGGDRALPVREDDPETGMSGYRRADLALALAALSLILVALLAFMLLSRDTPDSAAASPSPRASAGLPSLVAPAGVKASDVGASKVTLTWVRGAGLTPTSFAIVRDRTEVARTGPGDTEWTDSGLSPGTTYTYVVRAIAGKLGISSTPVRVKTGVPAVSAAALAGTWRVAYTVTSSSLKDAAPGQVATYEWAFVSACDAEKPCGGTWTIHLPNGSDPNGNLRAAGGRFLGSMRRQPLGSCGSSEIMGSIASAIHPLKASMVAGRWAATRFEGVFSESFTAQSGCLASELTATITGTRTS